MITTGADLEDYILEEYRNDDVELSSLFFDIDVSMPQKEILETYKSIQHLINGDAVIRMMNISLDDEGNIVDGEEVEPFIPEGCYEEIYTGNCKDFLKSFNGRELETGFCRWDDDDHLSFIF